MRLLIPLAVFALAAATACAVEPLPGPPADPVAESLTEDGYEPTSSAISPDEELLCLSGGDRELCDEPGELRWSLPLEGDYYLAGDRSLFRDGAGSSTASSHYDARAFHAVSVDDGVLHVENHLLRMLDADTGETLWRTDLSEEEGLDFLRAGLRGVHTTEDHVLFNYVRGLVRVSPDGEVVDHFGQSSCIGRVVGATEDAVALDECGDSRHPRVLDPATGETEQVVIGDLPEELDGTLTGGSPGNSGSVEQHGVFSRPNTDFEPAPLGLGTDTLAQGEGMTVAMACAPDGLGMAVPEQPIPGVPCTDPRLYAFNS